MSFAAADDVREQEGLDLLDVAARGEPRSHLPAAVAAIVVAPLLDGLFAVEEGDPDRIFSFLRTKEARELQHYRCGGTGVICADKVFL